jgi:hypothetical protein
MKLGRTTLLVISTVLGVGCAAHPFVRADPPVEAEGVRVGLVDQKCDRMIDPNWSYADILGLQVRVEVTNSTTDPVTFEPSKVRLLADAEHLFRPARRRSSRSVSLSGMTLWPAMYRWRSASRERQA